MGESGQIIGGAWQFLRLARIGKATSQQGHAGVVEPPAMPGQLD